MIAGPVLEGSLADLRELVRRTQQLRRYQPAGGPGAGDAGWAKAEERLGR